MKGRLAEIRAALVAGDHEKAHALEDALHLDTLRAIATGELSQFQSALLADMAASTRRLPIERWAA